MTVLETREVLTGPVVRAPGRPSAARRVPRRAAQNRRRPAGAPMRYRGPGVVMSRASHRRRPITPATTVGLALIAAAITV
ncbi:MAG TPA: peptigoglycan-binding protein LysM, partial [Mycobacterium sp.]|nr:peptigoglycan-binding protein LysM [Mycobacterium sp.]